MQDYCSKLWSEFVRPFDLQKDREGIQKIRNQKDLVWDGCGIHPTHLSRAFRFVRRNEGKTPEGEHQRGALDSCAKIYKFLHKHWQVSEEGWFISSQPSIREDIFDESTENSLFEEIIPHTEFPSEEFFHYLFHCEDEIKIIDTFTFFFQRKGIENTIENGILEWLEENHKIANGKKIKLLVLDPTGLGIKMRIKGGLWGNATRFNEDIMTGLDELNKYMSKNPHLIEVRLMEEFPGVNAYILPDCAFWGLHWSFKLSQEASFFEVQGKESHVFQDLNLHFDNLWNDGTRSWPLTVDLCKKMQAKLKQSNTELAFLTGIWEVFFHDRISTLPIVKMNQEHKQLGLISKYNLEIKPSIQGNSPEAILFLPNGLRLPSTLQIEKLDDADYVHVRFSDHQKLSFHLTFRAKRSEDQVMVGSYTMMNENDLCSGPTFIYPTGNDPQLPYTDHVLSFANNLKSSSFLSPLAFKNEASFSHKEYFDQLKSQASVARFAGAYKIYSYGRNEESGPGIQIHTLEILPFGYVLYKSRRHTAFGKASIMGNNLYITLINTEDEHRIGHFILHTNKVRLEAGRVFGGVFLGISYKAEFPIAKRVVFEWFDKNSTSFKPVFYPISSSDYQTLPKAIRLTCTGRIKNLIGFLREKGNVFSLRELESEWKSSIHFQEIFFYAACYNVLEGELKTAIKMMERAVLHGLPSLNEFKKFAERYPDKWHKIQENQDYINIKTLVNENAPEKPISDYNI